MNDDRAANKEMKTSTPKKTRSIKSKSELTSQTDWARIDAMKGEDIDFFDIPEMPAKMFARGVVRRNFKVVPRKKEFPIVLDSEVFWWFLKQGRDCDARINAVLRAYMEENTTS
jgi:uncharacterized protein (DUF4415 family)